MLMYCQGILSQAVCMLQLPIASYVPYKMKYWREYYLAKHIEKHFGGINIGDLDKIVSYMYLNCCSGLILMCACFPSGVVTSVVDMEAEAPCETCAYVVESCIRGHHVSKDFWTPLINEVLVCAQENENPHDPYAVAVKKGSLVVGHVPRKISAVCSLFLRIGTITATVRDSRQYSSDLLQGGLEVPCVLRFCGEVKNINKVSNYVIIIGGLNVGDFV